MSTLGRKTPSLYTNHFTRLDKKENRSGRYDWKCNYCGDDDNSSGACIEGRLCKRAPPAARAEALRFMADKKKTSKPSDNTSVSKDADDAGIDIDETETQVNEATTTRKKRKTIQGLLSSFIDNAMTTTQKKSADRKLLRFIIHANVAFRSVENPFT
ncbi:hypothetical protein DFH09DRAFT_1319647 [Mycena vulgaris]|nr:hypothetical protein DFH09DRAFT_1319647 [Mycena vulgaris]